MWGELWPQKAQFSPNVYSEYCSKQEFVSSFPQIQNGQSAYLLSRNFLISVLEVLEKLCLETIAQLKEHHERAFTA